MSRNFRFPTLNDLYFLPGGNPDLKKEHGISYDGGVSFAVGRGGSYSLHGEATWFDSYIDDWIVWLPTFKGFWTPKKNIKEVHAYGVELKAGVDWQPAPDWQFERRRRFLVDALDQQRRSGRLVRQGDRQANWSTSPNIRLR